MGSPRVELNTKIARQIAAEMAASRLMTNKEGITQSPPVSATPVRNPGTGSGDPINFQNFKVNIEEIAKRNGEGLKTVDQLSAAAAGTVSAPPQITISQEQLAKVGASDAIKFKSASLETTDAIKSVNSLAASTAYGKSAIASKNPGEFQPLKNAHVSEPSDYTTKTTLAQNNGANYTRGLSFANVNNLNNLNFMEIA